MQKNKVNNLKIFVVVILIILCSVCAGIATFFTKSAHAAVSTLNFSGEKLSTDLGYNMQAAENYYRFSVGANIQADKLETNGTPTVTSNKATVTLVMSRKDTGLTRGYGIFVAMFFRVQRYNYQTNSWDVYSDTYDWRTWFCASVHKSGNSTHYYNGDTELEAMKKAGQYPAGTVYEVSGDDKIN